MTIRLEPCTIRRCRHRKHSLEREYYAAPGFRARRNGCLLMTIEHHVRTWVSEERARKALERDWPGEVIVVEESEAAE